ncbi:MAG: hypothetical protein AUH78_08440 [Gemmatimonadetes bacterium 13_1_40CM_4_69_8]|nr:MAG: hypothetical protein AUH78_08440 [Gemmatimonadetes bacterium 13_1_40CM_4_69_8]PYP72187.1 MAG: hypothetical protein DMD41_09875 [Gemmatimonadota bacterium]
MADLKPMEMGEVLDGAFTLYRRHFGLFLRLSVAVMWLPVALAVYLRLRFAGSGPEQMIGAIQDHLLTGILVVLFVAVAYTLAGLLLTAGSIHIISASYLGRQPTLGEALSLGASRILPLFLVAVGKGLLIFMIGIAGAVGVGILAALGKVVGTAVSVLLVLAASCTLIWFVVYVACGYGLTTPVIVLEELSSSFDAFGRSWELTRTFKLKLLGLAVIAYLIANFVPSAFVGGVGAYAALANPSLQPAVIVVSALLPIVLAPILPCVFTLLYYDLRVRREGFDLQLLGQQLGIV